MKFPLQKFSNLPQKARTIVAWRWKNLRPHLRALATWRGQSPRVYLHNPHQHNVFETYNTHPALRYAPYHVARVCHWVNVLPPRRRANKGHIYEVEHLLVLTQNKRLFMHDWHQIYDDRRFMQGVVAQKRCRCVFTFSAGLAEHCKTFLPPELHHKLDFAYPAYPSQPPYERVEDPAFNILMIASRWTDKGLPEGLRAYEILRARHGERVRLTLVSAAVPPDYVLPPGVTHHNTPRMTTELKHRLYQGADVLYVPCFSETAMCFPEAYAFGVPVVTTRIHHGDEYVREGVTGFLLHAPLYCYSDKFGSRWKTWEDFLADVVAYRERGDLEGVIEESVERLDAMICGQVDMDAMHRAARQFHQESFSPEARNQKLLQIYARALETR